MSMYKTKKIFHDSEQEQAFCAKHFLILYSFFNAKHTSHRLTHLEDMRDLYAISTRRRYKPTHDAR